MPIQQITQLRKAGNLSEALKLAKTNLQNSPDDIWNKRALAWVYYEYLKNAQQANNYQKLFECLQNIKSLSLSFDESMFFSNILWPIGKFLYSNKNPDSSILNKLFDLICELPLPVKNDSYSYLLKAFNKHAIGWERFEEFVTWWGFDNFQDKDYEKFITDDGIRVLSTVESVYISISKKLLKESSDQERIKKFLPRLEQLVKVNKAMQYPPYYYAKLLLKLGDKESFLKPFLSFARKKQKDFWVWDLMTELYDKTSEEYLACLSKALLCGAPDKFTIKVREKMAEVFIAKKMFPEAKYEYEIILKTIQKEKWPIKNKHLAWQHLPWWNKITVSQGNRNLYQKYSGLSGSLLFADKPEVLIVIESVNHEKSLINFVATKEKQGFFHFDSRKLNPEPGEIYRVRFDHKKDKKSNFYKALFIHNEKKKFRIKSLKKKPGN